MTALADATPGTTPMSRLVGRVPGLTPGDWAVLRVWLLSRCAVLVVTWPAMSVNQGNSTQTRPWLALWSNWDAHLLQHIAQYGYFGPPGQAIPNLVAFFPGFPVAQALVHVLVRQWTVSGLLVSLIAGAVAAVALGRIAELDYRPGTGPTAVLFLVASPAGFFLAAGYTEALFLAFALTAWLAARNGRWALAALLTGGASFIRVNGIFLLATLAVAALLKPHGWAREVSDGNQRREEDQRELEPARAWGQAGTLTAAPVGQRIRALAALLPALIPPACYELYLKAKTGDWMAWQHAEEAGWYRKLTNPVDTFRQTWSTAFGHRFAAFYDFAFQLEILAVLVGVIMIIALAWHRRWPETVYAALTIGALATSVWYESVPRALLLLWPAWCGLAAAAARRRWVGPVYLTFSVPLAVVIGLLFMTGGWAG